MKINALLEGLSCTLPADFSPETLITGVVYDSRKVIPGCLFVCLRGAKADGHRFAAQAAASGAAAILAEEPVECDAPVILTKDTRYGLAMVSAAWFGHPAREMKVIGITGTKGKTTSSYMIHAILEAAGHKTGLIGTIGAVIDGKVTPTDNTTPESYEVQRWWTQAANIASLKHLPLV